MNVAAVASQCRPPIYWSPFQLDGASLSSFGVHAARRTLLFAEVSNRKISRPLFCALSVNDGVITLCNVRRLAKFALLNGFSLFLFAVGSDAKILRPTLLAVLFDDRTCGSVFVGLVLLFADRFSVRRRAVAEVRLITRRFGSGDAYCRRRLLEK